MTGRELVQHLWEISRTERDLPIVYVDEESGATVEIEGLIIEDGQIKLISGYTKSESGL